jgi:hypothetical protein
VHLEPEDILEVHAGSPGDSNSAEATNAFDVKKPYLLIHHGPKLNQMPTRLLTSPETFYVARSI